SHLPYPRQSCIQLPERFTGSAAGRLGTELRHAGIAALPAYRRNSPVRQCAFQPDARAFRAPRPAAVDNRPRLPGPGRARLCARRKGGSVYRSLGKRADRYRFSQSQSSEKADATHALYVYTHSYDPGGSGYDARGVHQHSENSLPAITCPADPARPAPQALCRHDATGLYGGAAREPGAPTRRVAPVRTWQQLHRLADHRIPAIAGRLTLALHRRPERRSRLFGAGLIAGIDGLHGHPQRTRAFKPLFFQTHLDITIQIILHIEEVFSTGPDT